MVTADGICVAGLGGGIEKRGELRTYGSYIMRKQKLLT